MGDRCPQCQMLIRGSHECPSHIRFRRKMLPIYYLGAATFGYMVGHGVEDLTAFTAILYIFQRFIRDLDLMLGGRMSML